MWTQLDRDKALWHAAWKALICTSCGTHPDEWDPKKGGARDAFIAVQHRCHGCAATEQAQAAMERDKQQQTQRGVRITLRRPKPAAGVKPGDDQGVGQ